jgi:hypothetical protein
MTYFPSGLSFLVATGPYFCVIDCRVGFSK